MNRKWVPTYGIGLFLITGAAALAFGQAALERRVSLDVNAVSPADAFASLAQSLGCGLEIDPAIKTPVTVRLPNITIRTALTVICESIGCGWRQTDNTLRIDATPALKTKITKPESLRRIFDRQTPADFKFQDTPLRSVLEALGKAGGIEISTEEPAASRTVTIDLSSRSIMSALRQIGQSTELSSAVIVAGFSNQSANSVKIKFAPRTTTPKAKKLPDKFMQK